MVSGGKREGSGRKSRGLNIGKISAYIEDRQFLNEQAKQLNIPVVELLHQILKHKDFNKLIEDIKNSEEIQEWYKKEL